MKRQRFKIYFQTPFLAVLAWTMVLAVIFIWQTRSERQHTMEIALYQAKYQFNTLMLTRSWNAEHGGVYVPITDQTRPNEYLKDPSRDVTTTGGMKLTKINPAYMTRQVAELASSTGKGPVFHITSMNPLQPLNIADSWEWAALKSFQHGDKERLELLDPTGDGQLFRYMAPLWTEKSCLKCHASQGYKAGDLRGGLSVTFSAQELLDKQGEEMAKLADSLGGVWLLGVCLIALGGYRHGKQLSALAASEKRFRSVADSSASAIVTLDRDGEIDFSNRRTEEIFARPPGEIVGRPFISLLSKQAGEHYSELLAGIGEDGTDLAAAKPLELAGVRRNGNEFPLEIILAFWRSGGERRLAAIMRDISDRKAAEEELKCFAARLEQKNQDLQDFTCIASKVLQKPLQEIQTFVWRLHSGYAEALGEQGRGYIERMQGGINRMDGMLTDLLTFTSVTTTRRPFITVNLSTVVNDVLSDMKKRIEHLGATVEVGDLPMLHADLIQIRLLVRNLLSNALKFHREDAPPLVAIKGDICRERETPGDKDAPLREYCRVIVEDNGIGFDEKYLDRIFIPFHRLHEPEGYNGTGMGLAICRKIVEYHGGTITAKSVEGEGTRFIITLPLRKPCPLDAAGE